MSGLRFQPASGGAPGADGAAGATGPTGPTADPVRAYSKLKAFSYDPAYNGNVTGAALTSGTIYFARLPLWGLDEITGMIVTQGVQGNYTADTTGNRVGLYSSDGTTLTLRAATAENGDLWKAAASSNTERPFATAYTPSSITLPIYGAIMHRNTASVTAPTAPRLTFQGAFIDIGTTGGHHRAGNIAGQTDLPATILHSSVGWTGGSGQQLFWMGAY